MAKWIELTMCNDKSKVWIDVDDCAYIQTDHDVDLGDYTALGSADSDAEIRVLESVQDIMRLTKGAPNTRPNVS